MNPGPVKLTRVSRKVISIMLDGSQISLISFSRIQRTVRGKAISKLQNVSKWRISKVLAFPIVGRFLARIHTPATPRLPTRLTTTNAVEINRREQGVNTCLGTTCHGSS